jgi:cytochrome c oxidase assembly protein subunit 11
MTTPAEQLAEKNRKVLRRTLGLVAFMVLVSFVSVPLYRLTCKVTGWGGTPQEQLDAAARAPHEVQNRDITVRFDAQADRRLAWDFKPDQGPVTVKVGEDKLVSFSAHNKTEAPITGTAVYNVTPLKAGKYFVKTECFCFAEQLLAPGQAVHMPVSFYIDPAIMQDRDMADVGTITLSYTFYRASSDELDAATNTFIEQHGADTVNKG